MTYSLQSQGIVRACFLLFMLTAISVSAQEKSPIPPDAAQQKALTLIKEVFGQEWADAKTAPDHV